MTNRLDDKISAFVLELVDDPPAAHELDFEAARRSAPSQLRRMPPQRRASVPVVAIVGAALLILIAVGLPVFLFSGGSEVVDEPTTTVVTTTTPPSTTAAPIPLSLPSTWQRVGAQAMTPVVGLFNMTETTSGLVAVGFEPGEEDSRQNGVILSSADGMTWNRLAEDDPALNRGAVLIYGVTEGGPGLVAVGFGCEDDAEACMAYPTVWTSQDGTVWNRSTADPDVFGERGAMLDVVNTEHGIVAAGGFYTGEGETELIQPTVWLSADGLDWERVWQDDGFDFSTVTTITGFQALATSIDGRVVGVGTAPNDQGEFVAAVWTSIDGRAWERIDPNSTAFTSDTGSDISVVDVASGPGGFVAVGTDGGSSVAIWHSSDGLVWTRADTTDQPFEYIGSLGSVDALGSGWIAAGPHASVDMTGGTVTLWTSPDGLNWDRVHSMDPGYAISVVTSDSGIAVGGAMQGTDNFHATVWAGPAFDPAVPPPDPGPAPEPVNEAAVPVPDEGRTCDELAESGYKYREVVAYWVLYERSSAFDPDGNGAPCETNYPAQEVEGILGGPDALAIDIILQDADNSFRISGPAVDAGMVCPAGTMEWTEGTEPDPRVLWRWEDQYTCDDGSGTFLLRGDVLFEDGQQLAGVWSILSGTGEYATLAGGGSVGRIYAEDFENSIGRMWLTAEED